MLHHGGRLSAGRPVRRPEFCPNPVCPFHNRKLARTSPWYYHYGFFSSLARGKTRRFRCKHCGTTSSTQTFSINYWTHLPINLRDLDDRLNSCAGYRQIARALGVSYPVIKNRTLRLSRNYLNLFDTSLVNFPLEEDIAFDGIESYLRSQYIPDNFNIAVGCTSQVPYAFTLSLFRRRGRMTDVQKKNRTVLDTIWRPEPRSLVTSCRTVFRDILSLYMNRPELSPFVLNTDEKTEYKTALKDLPEWRHLSELHLVEHRTVSSRLPRTRRNPLFPVNYLDREIRKNSAAHCRETVRGDREAGMTMARMVITLGYHTFRKPYRIDNRVARAETKSHADMVGLLAAREARKAFERLYTKRHVWTHQVQQAEWMEEIWLRRKKNPPVVCFRTGVVPEQGQPGNGWVARHLVV
jgi:hypothetical protein